MNLKQEAAELRRLWGGFWSARVLLTANNFRVFDRLETPKSAKEVAGALKADLRATEILLDALTALGLLKKGKGLYRNSSRAKRFLVTGSPHYMGDIIRHADSLWQGWSGLDQVVRTGQPNREAHHDHEAFIRGMHNLAALKAHEVVRAIGLKGVKRALDLGGGPGTYSMAMAAKGVSVTLFDMPDTVRIARDVIGQAGEVGIAFVEGDLLSDDFGKGYDLIFISQVFHAFSAEENQRTLKKCRKALNPGGRVAIQEFYIEDSRVSPPQSALFSVNMLVNTPGGRCYPTAEMKRWLFEAGFSAIADKMLDESVLVLGTA